MEGRNVLHARKASSLLTTMTSSANNGLSKLKYAHTHTKMDTHTAWNLLTLWRKMGSLGSGPPLHHQPAVMSNTSSPGIQDQTPASTAAGSVMMIMIMANERKRDFCFFSPSVCPSSLQIHLQGLVGRPVKWQWQSKWEMYSMSHVSKCSSSLWASVISSALPVVRPRAGVKRSQAALRLTQCVDHLYPVRLIHRTLSP